jgi:hypothetical protein
MDGIPSAKASITISAAGDRMIRFALQREMLAR